VGGISAGVTYLLETWPTNERAEYFEQKRDITLPGITLSAISQGRPSSLIVTLGTIVVSVSICLVFDTAFVLFILFVALVAVITLHEIVKAFQFHS
jgi:hypothetical protein